MKSKTIIISSQDENIKGRGILTLYEEDGLLKCKLRLYNTPTPNRYCKLGIYHQNEVFSANLLEKNGVFTSSFVGNFDIEKDFYTALVDTSNKNNVLLAGGTYAGYFFNDNSMFNNLEKENPNTNLYNYEDFSSQVDYSNTQTIENYSNQSTTTKNKENYENDKPIKDNEVSFESENCETECAENKCEHCKYKEFFYSQNPQVEENVNGDEILSTRSQNSLDRYDNIETQNANKPFGSAQADSPCHSALRVDSTCNAEQNDTCQIKQNEVNLKCPTNEETKSEENSILSSLIPQFNYVFENYPADETLNNLIPNGKFVKINQNKEQYSLGAIYENEEMKFICYAVLKDYNSPAPAELGEHYQWLPLDKDDPLSDGYYVVFQDTTDLKIVEM